MKPSLAFDTAALVSLGHTELVQVILQNYNIIVTQTILDELNDVSKFEDNDAEAARKWLKHLDELKVKESGIHSTGEEELFLVCMKSNIDFVSDDIKAVKKFSKELDCFFSVHIIYALFKKNVISKTKAEIEIAKMKQERSWTRNAISIAARILFR